MKREEIMAMMPRAHETLCLDMEGWQAKVQPQKQAAHADPEKARAIARAQLAAAFGVQAWLEGYCLTANGVALVPVFLELGPARYWPWGTTYEEISAGVTKAVADPSAKAVLVVIDSPGGYCVGLEECANALHEASLGPKPVHAYANEMAASAAFWLASATKRISTTKIGGAGSVGAMCLHFEVSDMLTTMGVKATLVRSGARKCEANMFEKLSEQALAQLQRSVDGAGAQFRESVAAWRGIELAAVEGTQAAYLTAPEALAVSFIDAIETPQQALDAVLAAAGAADPAKDAPQAKVKPVTAKAKIESRRATGSKTRASTQAKENGVKDSEKAKRRDEIAGVIGQDASEEASKAAQYDQIAGIVAVADPDAEDDASAEENKDGEDKAAKAIAAARAEDKKALALPEAKGRESAVLSMRVSGMSADAIKETLASLPAAAGGFQQARANAAQQPVGGDNPEGGEKKKSSLVADAQKKAAGGRG